MLLRLSSLRTLYESRFMQVTVPARSHRFVRAVYGLYAPAIRFRWVCKTYIYNSISRISLQLQILAPPIRLLVSRRPHLFVVVVVVVVVFFVFVHP